jgi:hypothetical protein
MKKIVTAIIASLALAAPVAVVVATAGSAEAAPRHWSSCASMQRTYPHGVGLRNAVDRTSGTRVRNFYKNDALYRANNGPRNAGTGEYDLDRDNDGIACEKR